MYTRQFEEGEGASPPEYLPSIFSSFLSLTLTSVGRSGLEARIPATFDLLVVLVEPFCAAAAAGPSVLPEPLSSAVPAAPSAPRAPKGSSVTASEGMGVPDRTGVPPAMGVPEAGVEARSLSSNSDGSFSSSFLVVVLVVEVAAVAAVADDDDDDNDDGDEGEPAAAAVWVLAEAVREEPTRARDDERAVLLPLAGELALARDLACSAAIWESIAPFNRANIVSTTKDE